MKYLKYLPATSLVLFLLTFPEAIAAATPVAQPPKEQTKQTGAVADTPVRLTAEQAGRFQSAFQTIADQAHVCILAEDAPIQLKLPEGQVSALTGSAPSAESLIERVAAAYDYTVEHTGPRGSADHKVFLLRKRFTQPNDLPDVTFDECRLSFAQVAEFVQTFKPQPPTTSNTNTVLDIADALSEEQLGQMARGLPIRSLTPPQRQLVWRLALRMYVQLNVGYVVEAGQYLDKVQREGIVKQGYVSNGHTYYSVWKNKLAYGVEVSSTDPILHFTPCCPESETANLNSPGIVAEANPFGDVGEAKPAPGTETLDSIVTDLSHLATQNKFSVDPVVAARRVSRFGVPYAAPETQVRALAALLDLQLRHRTQDEFALSHWNVPAPGDVTKLFNAVRAAVPAPIRRFAGAAPPPPPDTPAGLAPAITDTLRRDHASTGGAIARVQMRPALVAALKGQKEEHKSVPFSRLDERIRSRFAFYWVQEWLTSRLLSTPAETPMYISRFSDALLKGGWTGTGEQRKFEATILYALPDGESSAAGFTVGAKRFPD